jgi:hypothetical protein
MRRADSIADLGLKADPATIDAIKRRSPIGGSSASVTHLPNGVCVTPLRKQLPPLTTPDAAGPFSVRIVGRSEGSVSVTVKPGYIIERINKVEDGTSAIIKHLPMIDEKPLTDKPAPRLDVSVGQVIYCNFATDSKGRILTDEPPVIIADEEDKQSTLYTPAEPDADEGSDGEYCIPLAKVEAGEGENAKPVIVQYQRSDIEHYPSLWTPKDGEGDGESIAPKFKPEDGVYSFPKIKGKNAIKVEKEEDSVEVSINVTNTAHIRYFSVVIAIENASTGTLTITRQSESPELELWVWNGLVYLSEPEGFPVDENPRDLFTVIPTEPF